MRFTDLQISEILSNYASRSEFFYFYDFTLVSLNS